MSSTAISDGPFTPVGCLPGFDVKWGSFWLSFALMHNKFKIQNLLCGWEIIFRILNLGFTSFYVDFCQFDLTKSFYFFEGQFGMEGKKRDVEAQRGYSPGLRHLL